ncbi:putative protein [Arabidopsis thaliana]|uniref:KOW domain-containing protein n=3 Tax=Arabidopsis TaxID=3701 RepID=Q9STN2_ARATH|nr:KOW domain-containing protein [Arabidopsis thaliana]KAG7619778.1 hypothetical protein ISN44_As04g007860 [Arabidopsis suecica]AAM67441.1 unknown protein [Arabidopsis thaliana]AEE82631.1 KOW domain-containing protein [Arabidopsis thaliana]CAB52558.1 putative protein [Arabidopsis thaliana]CAB77961.1 putative protein [Arabidopsis thaliana]|eukprot:NP_192576.1 KOW domain-containing protein [Arabidopsis thaliana]
MSDQVSGKSTKFGKVKITSNNMDHHSCAEEYSDEDVEVRFMPDILVTVHNSEVGVIRDVSDGMCKVSLGSGGEGDTIMVPSSELEIVRPRKSDHVKILGGSYLGLTCKLIGIDGLDAIVKIDGNLDVKILDLALLAKFVQP